LRRERARVPRALGDGDLDREAAPTRDIMGKRDPSFGHAIVRACA
jgi:hypothetical protein